MVARRVLLSSETSFGAICWNVHCFPCCVLVSDLRKDVTMSIPPNQMPKKGAIKKRLGWAGEKKTTDN